MDKYVAVVDDSGNVISREPVILGPPPTEGMAIGLPIFFATTIFLAWVWNRTIEPACARLSKFLEDLCMESLDNFDRMNHKVESGQEYLIEEELIPVSEDDLELEEISKEQDSLIPLS